MRRLLIATCIAAISACAPAFAGDSSACYTIQDADARTYCRAKAAGDSSICYAIHSSALRSQCLAGA